MTDRDKLIQDLLPITDNYLNTSEDKHFTPNTTIADVADLLIEKGWIRPPCKVGDKVYDIQEFVLGVSSPEIYELKADEMTIEKGIDGALNFVYDGMYINNEDIGETVFLTKEEAENELVKRGEQNAR